MKKGLIMEGGAMRGMFTCGVIDVFLENEIEFDGGVGVSAGAAFGCNFKSKQIGRPIRYNKRFCGDPRYGSVRSLIKTGDVFDEDLCYHQIPETLDPFDDKTYTENPMEFYAVCTDVTTGKPVYHRCDTGVGEDILWFRASASMPMVSRVVEIDGLKLLDGGIADSIPVKFMESKGYDRNVVILTQPLDYIKKPQKGLQAIRALLKEYPAVVKAMQVRHIMYNRQTEYIRSKERQKELFVIRPPRDLDISRMESDPEELERVYQMGRTEGLKVLPELKKYLEI